MKRKRLSLFAVLGSVATGLTLACVFTTSQPLLAQSGSSSVQQGSGSRIIQQGSDTVQQGSSTFQQGSSTIQQGSGSSTIQQGSGSTQQGSGSAAKTQQGSGSGSRSGSAAKQGSASMQPGKKTLEQKMWDFIRKARYDQWAPAGDNGDYRASDRPHGALVKTYMNRVAAGNSDTLPHGSIIIKENFTADKTLAAVTLMYRYKDYNPDANDWYWAKYNPDGSVATMGNGSIIAGKAQGCIDCHAGAGGGDYSFFND